MPRRGISGITQRRCILLSLPEQFQTRERMGTWVALYENLVEMFSESVQELAPDGRS